MSNIFFQGGKYPLVMGLRLINTSITNYTYVIIKQLFLQISKANYCSL